MILSYRSAGRPGAVRVEEKGYAVKSDGATEALRSCAILTASAAGPLAEIHDRAPVVLPQEVHAAWLDRKLSDAHQVKVIADARMPTEQFTHYRVRLLVNNTDLNGPELIEPLDT